MARANQSRELRDWQLLVCLGGMIEAYDPIVHTTNVLRL